jgi:hypothetical protein
LGHRSDSDSGAAPARPAAAASRASTKRCPGRRHRPGWGKVQVRRSPCMAARTSTYFSTCLPFWGGGDALPCALDSVLIGLGLVAAVGFAGPHRQQPHKQVRTPGQIPQRVARHRNAPNGGGKPKPAPPPG